ncbi:acyl carrier protein [Streptomyces sp. NPDC002078]
MDANTRTRENIEELVDAWLRELEVEEPVDPEALLLDLGVDSLSVVDFSQMLRRELGVEIRAAEFDLYATVSEMVAEICERISAQ